ncbi:4-amino-4-deoxy-L-arabinose transferase [Veronia pacifica]|uniref:4-amino-4-deoxy-L-arabinose transferase n=2 Tax=Veronia pacifica TaxID=1080227 RepID=A0A1C3E9C7_9GAMM|nr:4-amino-4-deoxy-L-arabinose transferase [Veronia pacifica]
MDKSETENWRLYLIIAVTALVFSGLFFRDVWTPDEPRVAAIIHSMFVSGDFIIPRFGGIAFVEKPPLFFIFAAVLMHLTGLNEVMAGHLALAILCIGSLLVTYRLAWLVKGENFAWISVSILATFEGFILNFHWLRVDAALMFTTIAAIWAFAEAYLLFKPRYLLVAGMMTGLAFLSKGPIAIILCIGLAWCPLILRHYSLSRNNPQNVISVPTNIIYHILGIGVMCLVIAAWVYPFYQQASPELWHQWFWENQIGRFTGASTGGLGHDHSGKPFYYVKGLIEYTLPWTILFVGWFYFLAKAFHARQVNWFDGFLLFWFCMAIFILSYSATKRSMYLAPLMPLFALMAADAVSKIQGRWFIWYRRGWLAIFILFLGAFIVTPFWSHLLPAEKIPERLMQWLTSWHGTTLVAALGIMLMLVTERMRWPAWTKLSVITAIFFASTLTHLFPAINVTKDMRQGLSEFVEQIPSDMREKTAGIRFSETMSSIFYLFEDWPVPIIEKERAAKILAGEDDEYLYLLMERGNSYAEPVDYIGLPSDTDIKVLIKGHPRGNKGGDAIFLLVGEHSMINTP